MVILILFLKLFITAINIIIIFGRIHLLYISLFLITVISNLWIKYSPSTKDEVAPYGTERFEYFQKVFDITTIEDIAFQYDFTLLWTKELWFAVFTFLYVDLLDTSGTMVRIFFWCIVFCLSFKCFLFRFYGNHNDLNYTNFILLSYNMFENI